MIMMKNFIKLAAVGLAGYFIGFFEMKYKVMKIMLDNVSKESQQEEESK
jgi:hypothetical protein